MNKHNALLTALLISVAVNLLIAGFVMGKKEAPRREPPPMAWAAEQLSPELERKVRARMRAQMPQVRPLREELRKAQIAVRTAVAADNYDPQALEQALEKSREVSTRYQALIHKNLVSLSAELPKEQRIALAGAALQRGPKIKNRRDPRKEPADRDG